MYNLVMSGFCDGRLCMIVRITIIVVCGIHFGLLTVLTIVEHPEIREEVAKKDEQLAVFLKGMVVNPERMGEV